MEQINLENHPRLAEIINSIVIEKLNQEKRKVRKRKIFVLFAFSILVPVTIWATSITKPFTFADGATASASEVNSNFDTLYTKANELDTRIGTIEGQSYMRRTNGLTRGSTNTQVVIFGTAQESSGTDITYVNSVTNGDSFLINTSGIYSVSYSSEVGSTGTIEIRIGSTVDNLSNDSNTRALSSNVSPPAYMTIGWIGYVDAGKNIWILSGSAPAGSAFRNQITIARVR